MKKFVIFGNPVSHSKSPLMHNAAFKALNIDAVYEKYELNDGAQLKQIFLTSNFSGANITVPYKIEAFKQADILDDFAKKIGAVNTWVLNQGKIYGYNTDAPGFIKAVSEFEFNNVLLLGAGGTAKAIEVALINENKKVDILNRSDKSDEFSSSFYTWENFKIKKYDLVINSTSAGLNDDFLPTPKEILDKILLNAKYCFDCIYGKQTPFLQLANKYNKQYKDGTEMLLYQGVIALEKFVNQTIPNSIIQIMKKQL
jgi:shikimate dehydrogenase